MDAPQNHRIIGSMWVFKILYDQATGEIDRFKARLVARGDTQQYGVNYDETYAPVACFTSFRVLIAIAAHLDLDLEHIDITTAYLYGNVDAEIYMRQPPGCKVKGQESKVCKLNKSIYGLKQAGRIWNSVFHNFLLEFGLIQCISDECVYRLKLDDGKTFIVLLYVDDLIVASNIRPKIDALKKRIMDRFKVKILGTLKSFLNVEVKRDREKKNIWLKQSQYIEDVLSEFAMSECNPVRTPEIPNIRLHSGMCPQSDAERERMLKNPYREAVGSLIYLATKKRPDISHAVQQVAQFCENPGLAHWHAAKRIFAYLRGTADFGLEFNGNSEHLQAYFNENPTNCPQTAMFADSDWANDPDKRKSVGGYVYDNTGDDWG